MRFNNITAFSGLPTASVWTGDLFKVTGASTPYYAISTGATWQAITPVYTGVFSGLPAPSTVPDHSAAIVTDMAGDIYFARSGVWVKGSPRQTWKNPQDIVGAVFDGSTNITAQIQATLDLAYNSTAPGSFAYGKGYNVQLGSGVIKTGPVTLSTWTKVSAVGGQASAVWIMDHTGVIAPTALMTSRFDADQQTSIGSQPVIGDMAFNGNKSNATFLTHGYFAPEIVSGKDDAPSMYNTIWVNNKGDGIRIEKGHNQVRFQNVKSLANDGWGLWMDKSSDSKMNQVGFGRSLAGQVYLEDCASTQFTSFDIWTPGGGIFTGEYAVDLVSCRNTRFSQGEIQGVIHIEGGNSDDSDATQRQDTGIVFNGFDIKVSPETYQGVQYAGHTPTPGAKQYDSIIQMRSANSVKFIGGHFGYSQGPADADNLAATPKYIWKFTVPSGRTYANEAGYVEVTNCSMLHLHGIPGTADVPEFPFTVHWSNDPARVIFTGTAPGQVIKLPTAAVPINMKLCDGSSVVTADYPLAWLGQDFTRSWASHPTNFNLPDCRFEPTRVGEGWYIRLW